MLTLQEFHRQLFPTRAPEEPTPYFACLRQLTVLDSECVEQLTVAWEWWS